mgnify:CR=1 FL=1
MYCGNACEEIKWQNVDLDLYNMSHDKIENFVKILTNSHPNGTAINLGLKNLNVPLIYKKHFDEFRSKVFAFKEIYTNNAQVIYVKYMPGPERGKCCKA